MFSRKITGFLLAGTLAFTATQIVHAESYFKPGPYIGGQIGLGRIHDGDGLEEYCKRYPSYEYHKGGVAGKLFVGYAFNRYFGLEIGGTLYPDNKYKVLQNTAFEKSLEAKVYTFDLMAKGTLPFGESGWHLYGKLGPAINTSEIEIKKAGSTSNKYSKTSLRPGYAIGLGYNFNEHFGVDLSISGVYGGDKIEKSNDKELSEGYSFSASMLALGLTYKF